MASMKLISFRNLVRLKHSIALRTLRLLQARCGAFRLEARTYDSNNIGPSL